MTISVVIPVYNEEKRILDTLQAIYEGAEDAEGGNCC